MAVILKPDDPKRGVHLAVFLAGVTREHPEFTRNFMRSFMSELPALLAESDEMVDMAISWTGFDVGSVSLTAKELPAPEGQDLQFDFRRFSGANVKAGEGATTCGERYSCGCPLHDKKGGPWKHILAVCNTGVPDEKHKLPMNGVDQRTLRPCTNCMTWLINLCRTGRLIREWTIFVLVNRKTNEIEFITFKELVAIYSSLKDTTVEANVS